MLPREEEMVTDSFILKVSYVSSLGEAFDKTVTKLALSYDGHLVKGGGSMVKPFYRDLEFEFSNKQRMEGFIGELLRKHPEMTVKLLGP